MRSKLGRGALVVLVVAAVMLIYSRIGCPIKFFNGISCPGCGMSRAWAAALKLDFGKAFEYHPLFLLGPVLVVLIFLYERKRRKIYLALLLMVSALFVVVYFYRLFNAADTIVSFDNDGAFYKILRVVANLSDK